MDGIDQNCDQIDGQDADWDGRMSAGKPIVMTTTQAPILERLTLRRLCCA